MSTLTIQMPDSIAEQLRACATVEGVTVEHLRQRARRADFIAFLDASPDVPPRPRTSAATKTKAKPTDAVTATVL